MNMLKRLISHSLTTKKKRIVITVIFITIAFYTSMCSTVEKKNLMNDSSHHGVIYNVFEKNKEGLILPKYNFVDENYKGLNNSIKAYYYTDDQLYLKSFLAFPEKYAENTFISFSDDTISIGQKLKIGIYKGDDRYEVFYKNYQVISREMMRSVSLYHIPISKIGMDTVKIKQKSTNKYIDFLFWVTKENRVRADSILFYHTVSDDSTEKELIKKVLNPE